MSGHVFIVHGDITKLACDAWLLPGGPSGVPSPMWMTSLPREADEPLPKNWSSKDNRILRWKKRSANDPVPFLADVGGSRGTPIAWYVEAARQFLARATADLQNIPAKHGRARHLLALPLVGTGQGGKRREAGAVARELLPALYDFAGAHDADIALVMIEGAAYSAAQAVRKKEIGDRAWTSLEPHLLKKADRLASLAARRDLVLFI